MLPLRIVMLFVFLLISGTYFSSWSSFWSTERLCWLEVAELSITTLWTREAPELGGADAGRALLVVFELDEAAVWVSVALGSVG